MANFALVIGSLLIGVLARRFRRFPAGAPAALNAFVIHVSLPALAIAAVHRLRIPHDARDVGVPLSMAWLLLLMSAAFFAALGRALGWSRRAIGALVLTGGLGNTAFVGFPLIEALYGAPALSTAILVDQPGTFLAASTLGIALASYFGARSVTAGKVASRVLTFPPFLALLLGLCLRPWPLHPTLASCLDRLAGTLVPLALVSVGLQLDLHGDRLRRYRLPLGLGLAFKLVLAPALFLALYAGALGARGEPLQVTLVESAMAPMITAAIIATEYELEPDLANLMVSVGIPLSLVTVPAWAHLLRFLG